MDSNPDQYETVQAKLGDIIHPSITGERKSELIEEFEGLLVDKISQKSIHSRPPHLYVLGQSGSGKSSLINALVDQEVADVGSVEPTTAESNLYTLSLSGKAADWKVIDSRGLFESTAPDGHLPTETIAELTSDIVQYNPEFVLHVMTPDQIRAGKDNLAAVQQLDDLIIGGLPPRIIAINKIDTQLPPGDSWPPEQNRTHAQQIGETMSLVADIYSAQISHCFFDNPQFNGVRFDSADIIGTIPTYVKERPYWNIATLVDLLSNYLPEEGLLQSAQEQRRTRKMRQIARKQTGIIATAVGQLSRKAALSPGDPITKSYHRYLVGLVGTFSGAEFGGNTVDEYFDAISTLDRDDPILTEIIDRGADIIRSVEGKAMANLQYKTHAIGRSAEAYFFDGELVAPREFQGNASLE